MNTLIRYCLLFALCLPRPSSAQDVPASKRKNSVEVFIPVSHFFDESLTNWLIFIPHAKVRENLDGTFSIMRYAGLPVRGTFGASYIRNLGNKSSICFSVTRYGMHHQNSRFAPGETRNRRYNLYSAEYLHEFWSFRSMRFQAMGAVEYRTGRELIHIYSPSIWEAIVENLYYRDWGFSAGLRITRELYKRFFLVGEARYSRFLLFYDDGVSLHNGSHEAPTPHALTLKYSIGCRF